ncbi:hypothetical protein APY04_3281 [Hyphomicrobium sulfonivorans]|uniref:Uncharacterized protein n=1 Tax=Hyphomicrobium sulfonivorans TaxID=121290 RepID=A0A109B970_HYPSL|nr:hypothetical protein APY04_3281 [Hyphomicrobium sulfonivorans]
MAVTMELQRLAARQGRPGRLRWRQSLPAVVDFPAALHSRAEARHPAPDPATALLFPQPGATAWAAPDPAPTLWQQQSARADQAASRHLAAAEEARRVAAGGQAQRSP